ncbi:MAG: hypothetical protein ACRDVM_08430, partial [Acidimicrobiia bacterium]
VEGPVEISEDLGEMVGWATRIGGRYMGPDRAEELGRRNAVPGEWLVRLRPAPPRQTAGRRRDHRLRVAGSRTSRSSK